MGASSMSGFGRKGLAAEAVNQPSRLKAPSGSIRFDVTPHPWKMLFAAIACVAAALFSLALAVEGRGLILIIIPLSPTAAQIFYVLMALVCLAGLVHCVRGFFRSFGDKMWMTLDHHAITAPTQYGGTKTARIVFDGIKNVDLSSYSGNHFLVITSLDGKKIKVGSANLRDSSKWPAFLEELDRRLAEVGR